MFDNHIWEIGQKKKKKVFPNIGVGINIHTYYWLILEYNYCIIDSKLGQ